MHTGNAYCGEDEHCDVYYTTPGAHPDEVWQALGTPGDPAREPPDPTMANDLIVGDRIQNSR